MDVFWFLPTHGDGHYLGTTQGARPVTLNYLKQVAQAADDLGYHGVLIPTGRSCEDSWVIASALVPLTERLRYLVAIRPGIISPTVSARMAATLDRLSGGRLLINVVTGGDPDENRGDGSFLDHSERYEVTDEFLKIWRRVLQGEAVDFKGAPARTERQGALPARAETLSAAVFRRLFRSRPRTGCRTGRRVPDLGRTTGGRGRKTGRCTPACCPPGPYPALRYPPACHRARDRTASLGSG